MKNRVRIVALLSLVTFFTVAAHAQMIDSMMNVYSQRYPQEKIYVQFDKDYYNPGETIWFKAYIMSGTQLSDISKNFYAELLDESGKVLQRIISPVVRSSAASSFDIPAGYKSAALHFRAYTAWMLNFDADFLYEKNIPIISAPAVKPLPPVPTSFGFFPEGGDLVEGVESVLAFKATDRYGRPVKVKGTIFTSSGKKVDDFETVHYGMGTIFFTPVKGETYTARWKDSTNKEYTTALPKAKKEGIVMSLIANSGSVIFALKKDPEDTTGSESRKLILMGHINQQIVYKAKINFSAKSAHVTGSIPTDQFPAGIFQLTLFDDQDRPLQERIVFINNYDYIFDAYVNIGEKKLAKRGKNTIEIEVPDTLQSNLSISVTDANINILNNKQDNIYSRMLLTGDIKGYVYNPGYYFSSFADSVRRQLDLVMLTNGWRRFKWEDLAKGNTPPVKYEPESYLAVGGTVSGIDPSKLPVGTSLNMIVQFKDSSRQIVMAPVDKEGRFELPGLLFMDTASIYYQFNNNKGLADRVVVHVDNDFLKQSGITRPPSAANRALAYLPDSAVARNKRIVEQYAYLDAEKAKRAKVLDEVVITGRVKSNTDKLDERYASGMFRGGDGYSFDLMTDPFAASSISVFQYLQGKVAGLQISNAQSGSPSLSWRGGSPGLYLDEMQMDAEAIMNIPMQDIAYIKVFRPPFMGGFGGANGAIAIYTKKGGDQPADNSFKGLSTVKLAGYSPVKEFYSPDYSEPDPNPETSDLRTTLYWNPYLFFDKDKKRTTITFYNNDITKKINIVIEGLNENGKLTRVEEIIQ